MEQLKIFESEEFGQYPNRDERWRSLVRRERCGRKTGVRKRETLLMPYRDTCRSMMIKLSSQIAMAGQMRNVVLINESGMYALIFGSKLESAQRFKRWVTSEVLPVIRKTGSYEMDDYSPEMKAILMHDKKLVKIDNRVTDLENHMTIDYGEQVVLGDEVNKAVLDALGGKHSNAYNEIGKKVFAECNRDLKHYFHVNARNNVPKKRYYEALEYIQEWKPCTNTQIQIRDCNAQVCMP